MSNSQHTNDSYGFKAIASMYIGLTQGCTICVLTHPLDLIKTKLQANPKIGSGVCMSYDIFKNHGIRGFYAGGSMNFSRVLVKGIFNALAEPVQEITNIFLV